MTSLLMLVTSKTMTMMNPMFLAITILVISLMSASCTFKSTMTSWMSFVLILTFSSGMMTLFMYTASMTSNEKSKHKKKMKMIIIMIIALATPTNNLKETKSTMKMFSNKTLIMIMATILIITMVSISTHGHHPNQTISTSF